MSKAKWPLLRAANLAERVRDRLAPGCERIEIAGSIRRRARVIGDIEILAIPTVTTDLLGNAMGSPLNVILAHLIEQGKLVKIKGGDRYKQYLIIAADIALDLFICPPEAWGIQFLIRTGPAVFSRRMVTPLEQGGLMPNHLRVRNGRLCPNIGAPLETPEEADVFAAYGMEFIPPEDRE